MTTNDSGKLNMGGVAAIKDITVIPPSEWSPKQADYLDACLTSCPSASTLVFVSGLGQRGSCCQRQLYLVHFRQVRFDPPLSY